MGRWLSHRTWYDHRGQARRAEAVGRPINARLELDDFGLLSSERAPMLVDRVLRPWHRRSSPTFKPSFERNAPSTIEVHLVPHFGDKQLRDVTQHDLLGYIGAKLDAGLAPSTVMTGLSMIRRALVRNQLTTPKSGRCRTIALSFSLCDALLDLLGDRRRESISRGWPEVPAWVFCSETGGPLDERNFERSWLRLRRRAQKRGVPPLELHCTRHTCASRALAAGKSLR